MEDEGYIFIDQDQGRKNLHGFVKYTADIYTKEFPQPTWLTKTDFTEHISALDQVAKGSSIYICRTDVGSRSGYDIRFVEIDLANPDRKNWVEVLGEDALIPNADLSLNMIANGQLHLVYLYNGYNIVKTYDMSVKPYRFVRDWNFPLKGFMDEFKYDKYSNIVFF